VSLDRRKFLQLSAGAALVSALPTASFAAHAKQTGFKAIAFDGFPIFDPRPIPALIESLFPGKGLKIWDAWRTRLFEYQWLRALSGHYVDFLQAAHDSLEFTATKMQLDLTSAKREQLLAAWTNLQIWPDVPRAISELHNAGLRLSFLSNMTSEMLIGGLKNANLDSMFEAVISTDRIRSYKPAPKAYQLGMDTLQLDKEEILFVAFAGWDVAGAKWFGYPTFWVNRLNSPQEQLDVEADATGADLFALVKFVLG